MSWDFSGEQPEIIVYETQADVPHKFRANLIERETDKKTGKTTIKFWNIYFDAATYEGAIKQAGNVAELRAVFGEVYKHFPAYDDATRDALTDLKDAVKLELTEAV